MVIVGIDRYELDHAKGVVRIFLTHEGDLPIRGSDPFVELGGDDIRRNDSFATFKTRIGDKYGVSRVSGGQEIDRVDASQLHKAWSDFRPRILRDIDQA